jgi:hypothetical protein
MAVVFGPANAAGTDTDINSTNDTNNADPSTQSREVQATERDGYVRVAASDRYKAERVHRFALGGGYRDLWQAEIELPVLDLSAEGGLVPTGRFGGLQTAVLGLKGGNGRSYSFRGTDKDPSAVLGPLFKDTVIETLVQDQMAAQHPGGPPSVGVISEAAGILTVHEHMVVMPDDPALGEYREEFAGMVGTFFEFPMPESEDAPGFHDATEIIGQKELYERLERSPEDEVDVKAFLRARLLDILIGDFDRHRKQWRWAKIPGNPKWQPIPEDRDMAFVRYDGAGPRVASVYVKILQNYGPKYPSMQGLTYHGWEQDRWLLPALSWPEWEAIALDMQARITDEIIDEAISAQPPEYVELDGERLRKDLRGRRDRLVKGARSFYEHLAGEVNVQGTDAAEQVTVTREPDGTTLVEVRQLDPALDTSEPTFSRRFDPDDTNEVRIYLREGDDQVEIVGEYRDIWLRVISGGFKDPATEGRKRVDDSQGGSTKIYDETGIVEVKPGPGTVVDQRPYVEPKMNATFVDVKDIPPRDWGSNLIPIPQVGYEKDVGAFLGAGLVYTRYGFRKDPWSSKHRLTAGVGTESGQPRVHYGGRFRVENSELMGRIDLHASGLEILRFYGFGNNTSNSGSGSFFRVRNQQYRAAPSLEFRMLDEKIRMSGGPWVQYTRTKDGNRKIDQVDPYGADKFGMVGAFVNLQFDTRRAFVDEALNMSLPIHDPVDAGFPTSGFLVDFTVEASPPVWDVTRRWAAIEGSVSAFLGMGKDDWATLALRFGGRDTYGRTPYFKAAYLGGGEFFSGGATIRGFRAERWAGESSAYGNAELRMILGRVKIVVPGDFGLIAFYDTGRVFEDGDSSDQWHQGYGGGVFFAPLARTNAIRLTVGHSDEDTLVYMGLGFGF